jgi:hypothetical protein
MKTNIRTLIGIFALVWVGTLNGYSTSGTKSAGIAGEEKKVKVGLISADETIATATEKAAVFSLELKSETLYEANSFLAEGSNSVTDYVKEAQLVTRAVVDQEEAKVIHKLVEEGKLPNNQ